MKKILILLTILCMANVAVAVPEWAIHIDRGGEIIPYDPMDPIDVAPSDLIFMDFQDYTNTGFGGLAGFTIGASNGEFIDVLFNPGPWNMIPFAAYPDQFYNGPEGAPSGFVVAIDGAGLPDPTSPDLIFTLVFHVPDYKEPSDEIFVDYLLGGWDNMYDFPQLSVAFHVSPEPMTIALLGLGGLFLVRRRKK